MKTLKHSANSVLSEIRLKDNMLVQLNQHGAWIPVGKIENNTIFLKYNTSPAEVLYFHPNLGDLTHELWETKTPQQILNVV